MNSQLQRHYLKAMGIELWLPREAPHSDDALSQEAGLTSAVVDSEAKTASPAPGQAEVETEDGGQPLEPARSITPEEVISAVPQLLLAVLRCEPATLVCCELPWSSDGTMQPPYRRLLQDILLALNLKPIQEIALFHWPLLAQSDMDQSQPVAKEAVAAFLANQQQSGSLRQLILLGEQAKTYLSEPLQAQADLSTVATLGLEEILRTSSAKARLWRDLQSCYGPRFPDR